MIRRAGGRAAAVVRVAAVVAVALGQGACSSTPARGALPVADPTAGVDAGPEAADLVPAVPEVVPEVVPERRPRWLRGSTHVHAAPSGDSTTDVAQVIAWYEHHGYDFIVLTDHNRVTAVAGAEVGAGAPHVRWPDEGLVVLAGIELTFNPGACEPPPPEPDGRCRIHVNALGVTGRPEGKVEWADRATRSRRAMYRAALRWMETHGGLAQLNHPQWHWGMTPELLGGLAADGVRLVEIANVQCPRWNAGTAAYPSMEALWDAVLTAGATMWGVASDDAHDYRAGGGGTYPAGGGWVMVDAPREPQAILDALAAGRFYASTGVALARAEVRQGALEVEVEAGAVGRHLIRFIGAGGAVLDEVEGPLGRFPLDRAPGYLRVVVERGDGARAWVQPVRTAAPSP